MTIEKLTYFNVLNIFFLHFLLFKQLKIVDFAFRFFTSYCQISG